MNEASNGRSEQDGSGDAVIQKSVKPRSPEAQKPRRPEALKLDVVKP